MDPISFATHDGGRVVLADELAGHDCTVLVAYAGQWDPICCRKWKELRPFAAELRELDVALFGVSAETPRQLRRLHDRYDLPFVLLSDPHLEMNGLLGIETISDHPMARGYPEKAFLTPALFVWLRDGRLVHQWRQPTEGSDPGSLSDRPTARDLLKVVRDSLG